MELTRHVLSMPLAPRDWERAADVVGRVRVRIWIEKLGRTSLVFGFKVLPLVGCSVIRD